MENQKPIRRFLKIWISREKRFYWRRRASEMKMYSFCISELRSQKPVFNGLREGTPTEMLAALGANEMYAHKDKDTDEDAEGEGIPHVEDSEKQ